MIEVIFGVTTKRVNSTYQAMKEPIPLDVVLKENTSIINPTFIVKASSTIATMLLKCNYCRCVTMHRYYWIDDIVCTSGNGGGGSGIFEIHCHCDVLASLYDYVKEETHFVKYTGDIKNADLQVDDERLSPEIPLWGSPVTFLGGNDYLGIFSTLTYIIKVKVLFNGASASILYAVTASTFKDLMNDWITKSGWDTDIDNWDDFSTWMMNKMGGISNNISDFLEDWWVIMINPNKFPAMTDHIYMGTWDTGQQGALLGYGLTARSIKDNFPKQITLPSPIPNTTDANQMHFLKGKKYTHLAFKSSGGTSDASSDSFVLTSNKVEVQVKMVLDIITGEAVFEIWDLKTNTFIGSTVANLRFTPTTGNNFGSGSGDAHMDAAVSAFAGFAKAAAGYGLAGAVTTTAGFFNKKMSKDQTKALGKATDEGLSALSSASSGIIGSLGSTPRSGGAGGGTFSNSIAGFNIQTMNLANKNNNLLAIVTLIMDCCVPAVCTSIDSYNAYAREHGYPCSKMLKLGDLANNTFVQCSMASIAAGGALGIGFTPGEISEFNQWLNTGIFIDASTGKKDNSYEDPEEARKKLPGVIYVEPKK